MKVFWSWQSDRPAKATRTFIQRALESAIKSVASDLDLSPAERPELDHDTKGEAGLVEVVKTIFDKIEKSTVFVADVTPVAKTDGDKEVANPNVMIELGHAMKSLGHEAIILVTNTAYGGKPEDLPFDLRHRRGPVTYELLPDNDKNSYKRVEQKLTADLTSALAVNLKAALLVRDGDKQFERYPTPDKDTFTWLVSGEPIKHGDFFKGAGEHSHAFNQGVMSYLLIVPSGWMHRKPTRLEVHDAPDAVRLLPLGNWSSGDGGANQLGTVMVGWMSGSAEGVHTATQWFDKTGEVWGVDASVVTPDGDRQCLSQYRIVKDWSKMLARALAFYQHFGAKGPYLVEVGVGGLMGTSWSARLGSAQTPALEPSVSLSRISRDWEAEAIHRFLADAFNQLCNAYNQEPIDSTELSKILA